MSETDMVNINYGQPPEAWAWMQENYRKHLEAHPTCEICNKRPSVRITPLGRILAACLECIQQQRDEMNAEMERQQRIREEW